MCIRDRYIVAHGISTTIEGKTAVIGSYHFVFEDENCKIPAGEEAKFEALPDVYKRQIKVSVVVPVYNVDEFLDNTLSDITGQTLREIEIICVDDGSTDNSCKIIEEWMEKDSRIQLIRQKNQYAGVARNNGLKQAHGKYVICLLYTSRCV